MKISLWLRGFVAIFLTVATIFGFGIRANALFFAPKNEIASCEALVADAADSNLTGKAAVESVQAAIDRIAYFTGGIKTDGSSLAKVEFSGFGRKLRRRTAQKIITRLNGILRDLNAEPNDVFVREFRGKEEIAAALNSIETNGDLVSFLHDAITNPNIARIFVSGTGGATRAYVDHIVYFNKGDREPIWLFVYRPNRHF